MHFSEFLKENIVILDGGMGTLLQNKGLAPGELPERWNISHPEVIKSIHEAYFNAGSNVVSTNTFGANSLKFDDGELESVIAAAFECANAARRDSVSKKPKFIALDIGPTGHLLKPYGDLDFENATEVFAKTVRLGAKYGADLIIIETMNDSYETKAALIAAKENSSLPIVVTNAYGEDGKLVTGATPEAMVAMLEGLGADAIGANCSLGPKQLMSVTERILKCASVPVVLKPNAGLPKICCGETVYDTEPEAFAECVCEQVVAGVRLAGGCCGTTPEYIKALAEKLDTLSPTPLTDKNLTVISSHTHAVYFGTAPVLIGERINPTGKKKLKEALLTHDLDHILNEATGQTESGAHALDVNVGTPGIDEKALLPEVVKAIQAVTNLPLQIDTGDAIAMEAALRIYNGKPLINSVNGKPESLSQILPLAKKYGGTLIALTLDENGIPDTADGRVEIAKRILRAAERYGISKNNIIFDPLAMTVSTNPDAARVTLEAIRRITDELGCRTSLGVSNVSFGLPCRDAINSAFFTMALSNGLSAAIMNPYSEEMIKAYHSYCALSGFDEGCTAFIRAAQSFSDATAITQSSKKNQSAKEPATLAEAIARGLKGVAQRITTELINLKEPLAIVEEEIIPALNKVGDAFECGRAFLPELLMSAEAAKCSAEIIKSAIKSKGCTSASKGAFVLATVKGDIHDIGKNIVKLLLENYGYEVIDLGRDVPKETILEATLKSGAMLVGLSALMTTTLPAMKETVELIKAKAPFAKIVVGGAVLTREYAERIGADAYAKDAMATVRFAESIR